MVRADKNEETPARSESNQVSPRNLTTPVTKADVQEIRRMLVQIRDTVLDPHPENPPASPAQAPVVGNENAGLRIDSSARLAFWNGRRLSVNAHADFSVLSTLLAADGAIVPYVDLERSIDPNLLTAWTTVDRDTVAPQNVKDAVTHIRAAFRKAGCPPLLENVRQLGYRLLHPTNNLLSSTSTTPTRGSDGVSRTP